MDYGNLPFRFRPNPACRLRAHYGRSEGLGPPLGSRHSRRRLSRPGWAECSQSAFGQRWCNSGHSLRGQSWPKGGTAVLVDPCRSASWSGRNPLKAHFTCVWADNGANFYETPIAVQLNT